MKGFLIFLLSIIYITGFGQLKIAKIFSDHAVLQRQKPIAFWGWASPKEQITVNFSKQTVKIKADAKGKWLATFPAMEAGGPFALTIKGVKTSIVLTDIMIGEVWVCSGQSNMEWTVDNSMNFPAEKFAANYPNIRHFKVEKALDFQPQTDLQTGSWTVCSPATVGSFTAVGYFFAKEVFTKLNIPIGLINTSWGGSQIEDWISKEGFQQSEELKYYLSEMPHNWQEADSLLYRFQKQKLLGSSDVNISQADEIKYFQPDHDYSKWQNAYAPSSWDWQGIWAYRGTGYSTCEITVSESMVKQATLLGLAYNDSRMTVYINGKQIWEGEKREKHIIEIPANTWKTGKNRLVLKYGSIKNPDWFGLGLMGNESDLFVKTTDNSETIPLYGSIWKQMPSFAEPHSYYHSSNNAGINIYNAMVNPLIQYEIRGVIWYQGESNAERAYQYRKAFPALINDWRQKWGETFPFYFVQLSSFGANQNSNEGCSWAELREAQTITLSLPNTGMIVTTDIGNAKDVHPRNKQDVGKRLAFNALKQTYGFDIPCSSPKFQSVKFDGAKAIISFSSVEKGLITNDKYGYIYGFEIAGEDKVFYYAKAQIIDNNVVVSCSNVTKPVAVRYAWSDAPIDANLFNSDGFPVCPFRTDNWKGITEEKKFNR